MHDTLKAEVKQPLFSESLLSGEDMVTVEVPRRFQFVHTLLFVSLFLIIGPVHKQISPYRLGYGPIQVIAMERQQLTRERHFLDFPFLFQFSFKIA